MWVDEKALTKIVEEHAGQKSQSIEHKVWRVSRVAVWSCFTALVVSGTLFVVTILGNFMVRLTMLRHWW